MSAQHSLAVPHARIDTDRLRLNHPIADLIARYGIELRRSGSTLVGRCPFHQDGGRPNLTVFPRSGRFVCFRCQARGDAISFVQQLEHVTFREAAERLGADPNPSSIGGA
jgi:DNA primase